MLGAQMPIHPLEETICGKGDAAYEEGREIRWSILEYDF